MRLLLLFISLLIFNNFFAQIKQCGTIETPNPSFNIESFQSFKEKIKKNRNARSSIYIPVKAHIVRMSDGYGGLSEASLIQAMVTLNEIYNPAGVIFFLCGDINFINDSQLYYFDSNTETSLIYPYYEVDAINIYFFKSVLHPTAGSVCGFAHYPWDNWPYDDYIAMDNDCVDNGNTLSHEIGHFFGLRHTHSTFHGIEYVNGINCNFTGDLCCDTPADPELSYSNVNTSCIYIGNDVDPTGTPYIPDPTNIMSYARHTCRNYISPHQFDRVLFFQNQSRSYLSCINPNDISIRNFNVVNELIYVGETLNTSVEQNYTGSWLSADLPESKVGYYLSTDTILDINDLLIHEVNSNLGADLLTDTINIELNFPSHIMPGDYFLILRADDGEVFEESDENNNTLFSSIKLLGEAENNFSLFPNPVSNNLLYNSREEVFERIEILNNIGQTIKSISELNGSINMSNFPIGSYFIKFTNADNKTMIYHVIKQ